ncbi:MAG: hypothetical protein R3F59_25500 [Myxococcota bacterium]
MTDTPTGPDGDAQHPGLQGPQHHGLEIVERSGRQTAFALVVGWLFAGLAAASVDGAAGLWLMSLPFGALAVAASLARRRVVRVDRRGLTVRQLPFGPGYTVSRAEIAYVTANGRSRAGWSVVVGTRSGEARRVVGAGLTAERARALAHQVRAEVR